MRRVFEADAVDTEGPVSGRQWTPTRAWPFCRAAPPRASDRETSPELRATVDTLHAAFAYCGGVDVIDVRNDPPPTGPQPDGSYRASTPRRQPAIDLIRPIERADPDKARNLADVWMERIAVCEIDGGLPPAEAEAVALNELRTLVEEIEA